MSRKLVETDEILQILRDHGPLPTVSLARALDLWRLDAAVALRAARTYGLVRRNRQGAWRLTGYGLATLTCRAHRGRDPERSEGQRLNPKR